MTAIPAIELKNNFKEYAGLAASGEIISIKRPKDEPDLILLSQKEYEQILRLSEYAKFLSQDIIAKEEDDEKIVLFKRPKHKTLEERIEESGVSIINNGEIDWYEDGTGPRGREIW